MKIKKFRLGILCFTVFVFLASLIIRWWDVGIIPYGIEEDEVEWIATAKFLGSGINPLDNGVWSLHLSNTHNYPFSLWVNQLSFLVFGNDLLSARKMLIIVSVLSLVIFYGILRRFLRWHIALLTTALYSLSAYKLISSKIVLPSVYQELPVLSAILLVLVAPSLRGWMKYFTVVLSGVFVVVGLLTYNCAYLAPIFVFGFLIYSLWQKKNKRGQFFANALCFFLPIIIASPFLLSSVRREFNNKQYIFEQSGTQTSNLSVKVRFDSLYLHGKVIYQVLWKPEGNRYSDMLLKYTPPQPVIPRLITVISLVGLILASIFYRKYWPFLVWLVSQILVYHIILGFNFPRVWCLTLGAVYLFFGVAWQEALLIFNKRTIKMVINIIFIALTIWGIVLGVRTYYSSAVNSPAYRPYIREAFDLTKLYGPKSSSGFWVVPGQDPFWKNAWLSSIAFYGVKGKFSFLSPDDFKSSTLSRKLPKCASLITEQSFFEESYRALVANCANPYKVTKYQVYSVAIPQQTSY